MAHSLIIGCLKVGMNLSIACPKEYMPKEEYITRGKELASIENTTFAICDSPVDAVKDADVVITDAWISMGHEDEADNKIKAFEGYQVNEKLLSYAQPNVMVLHCLPAHRGQEISAEVLEEHADEIFDESENRLHAQKAVLVKLMKNN